MYVYASHLSVISLIVRRLGSSLGCVMLIKVMLLVIPFVLVPPALALLILSPQLCLKLAEALYLAGICLKQPGQRSLAVQHNTTQHNTTQHMVGALCTTSTG